MTEKAKRLIRLVSEKIFGNSRMPNNRILCIKEIKREAGTATATINLLPSGKTQLYVQYDDDCIVGNGLSMSLEFDTPEGAMNAAEQIENSFHVWKKK